MLGVQWGALMNRQPQADVDTDVDLHTPTTPEEIAEAAATAAAAMRTVANYAVDVEDCRALLAMLGLHGGATPACSECGDPIGRHASGGYNRAAGNGKCGKCFEAEKRQERKERREAEQAAAR